MSITPSKLIINRVSRGLTLFAIIASACGPVLDPCGARPCVTLPDVPGSAADIAKNAVKGQVFFMDRRYFENANALKDILDSLELLGRYVRYVNPSTGQEEELPYLVVNEPDPADQNEIIYASIEAAKDAEKTTIIEIGPGDSLTPIDTSGNDKFVVVVDKFLDVGQKVQKPKEDPHAYLESEIKPPEQMGRVIGFQMDALDLSPDIQVDRVQMFGPNVVEFPDEHLKVVQKATELIKPGGEIIIVYGLSNAMDNIEKQAILDVRDYLSALGYKVELQNRDLAWLDSKTGGARDSVFLPGPGRSSLVLSAQRPQN